MAQRKFDELAAIWHDIAQSRVITLVPMVQRLKLLADLVLSFRGGSRTHVAATFALGALTAYDLYRIGLKGLYSLLGAIDPNPIVRILAANIDFERLAIPLIVSATNITSGQSDAFWWFADRQAGAAFAARHDKGTALPLAASTLRAVVQASTSIPFAFAPVTLSDESEGQYVDGGVANNTPIGVAIDAGATDITIVFLDPDSVQVPQPVTNLAAVGLACFGIMQQRILSLDLKNARRVNAAVDAQAGGTSSGGGARQSIGLHEIRPKTPLPISVLQFDQQDRIDAVYERGVADGKVLAAQQASGVAMAPQRT